jgi:hypothetical protein
MLGVVLPLDKDYTTNLAESKAAYRAGAKLQYMQQVAELKATPRKTI